MKHNFKESLRLVLQHEGSYVNHPKDPGGATNMGITLRTARRYGVDVDGDGDTDIMDIKKLRRVDAEKIYKGEYWDRIRGDDLPSGLDYAVFDFAVNSGVSRAAIYLQKILGVAPDGRIGPLTIAQANQQNTRETVSALCAKRLKFLKRLSIYPVFGRGWNRRVKDVKAVALRMAY